jgi:hypothetical protein
MSHKITIGTLGWPSPCLGRRNRALFVASSVIADWFVAADKTGPARCRHQGERRALTAGIRSPA